MAIKNFSTVQRSRTPISLVKKRVTDNLKNDKRLNFKSVMTLQKTKTFTNSSGQKINVYEGTYNTQNK